MTYRSLLLAAAFALPFCPASAATLTEATVSELYYFPDTSTPYPSTTYSPQSFVVGPGQESAIVLEGVTTFNIDFADQALDIVFDTTLANPSFANSAFNGLIFTSTAFPQITGATVNPSSNLAGFDASRVTRVDNDLRIDWNGLSYDTNTVLSLSFTTAAVPEPGTWALMILGFGLIGGALRRHAPSRTLTRGRTDKRTTGRPSS